MTKRFTFEIKTRGNKAYTQWYDDGKPINSAETVIDLLNTFNDDNEQLKKELKVYRKVASCSNCKYHNYDWNIDDGYGGEEYEVCDKGNDVTEGICEEWEEL